MAMAMALVVAQVEVVLVQVQMARLVLRVALHCSKTTTASTQGPSLPLLTRFAMPWPPCVLHVNWSWQPDVPGGRGLPSAAMMTRMPLTAPVCWAPLSSNVCVVTALAACLPGCDTSHAVLCCAFVVFVCSLAHNSRRAGLSSDVVLASAATVAHDLAAAAQAAFDGDGGDGGDGVGAGEGGFASPLREAVSPPPVSSSNNGHGHMMPSKQASAAAAAGGGSGDGQGNGSTDVASLQREVRGSSGGG